MRYHIPKIALALCVVLALFAIPASAAEIVITPDATAGDLVNKIVGDPTISNINVLSSSLFGAGGATQSATFDYPTGTLHPDVGFNGGIILTNGSAIGIKGNYYGDENYNNDLGMGGLKKPEVLGLSSSGLNKWNNSIPFGSDTSGANAALNMLASLLPPGTPDNPLVFFDANVLEFQFTLPNTAEAWNLSFRYVFASEEYIDYATSDFFDAFGFFIDGTNVAVLSDGTTPISVNSIYPTDPYNPDDPATLYLNNVPGCWSENFAICGTNHIDLQSLNLDLEPDGLTKVLTTKAITLGGGTTPHTATLVIADVNDPAIDSAVFIQGGSFMATPASAVPEPGTLILIGTGLAAVGLLRRRNR